MLKLKNGFLLLQAENRFLCFPKEAPLFLVIPFEFRIFFL